MSQACCFALLAVCSNLKERRAQNKGNTRALEATTKIATFQAGVKGVPARLDMCLRYPLLSRHCQELKNILGPRKDFYIRLDDAGSATKNPVFFGPTSKYQRMSVTTTEIGKKTVGIQPSTG